MEKAELYHVPVWLPEDHVVAEKMDPQSPRRVVTRLGESECGFDIGPKTAAKYSEILSQAKTIFWNGPMGVFEMAPFAEGTMAVARAIADSGAETVVGGGESVAAIHKSGVAARIAHLSTGGGATLEYLEGKPLPGLKALME